MTPTPAFLFAAACLALATGLCFADRPAWMPSAPPLPVTGRPVQVSTVDQLATAVTEARDGDTILLADGTYQLSRFVTLTGKTGVTVRGASGDASKVIIRGLGWDSDTDRDDLLRIQGCSDITIAYLTFTDAHAYGIKLENLLWEGRGLRNINIYACNFRNIGTRAIKGTGGNRQPVEGGTIRYCNFQNTKVPPPTWYGGGDYITAIDCMRLKDWVISDNYFRDIRGAAGGARGAIFVWVDSQNVISERNVFVNCDNSICYGNPSGSSEHPQGPHNTGGIIRNNFILGGVRTGIEICWADGLKVYHNTVLTPDPVNGRGIHYLWRDLINIHIANNIVRGRIFGDEGDITRENNLTAGIQDSWFRSIAEGDLHLTAAAAPAIDKVDRLPDCPADWDGQPRPTEPGKCDIGADEYEGA